MRMFGKNKEEEEIEEMEREIAKRKGKKSDIDVPEPSEVREERKQPVQVVEREVNLTLINDKLNFIISLLEK